ncbi:MFS transporter [Thioclava sp. SK-1]|uniref:MFS transporter n=1 Tax=Thioclava sp. SK-1 TaxID=1889770 RepID=UPI0008247930|nr:MFS transporter [Thioclava sp. SK-1]OCX65812.1 MFS transporter [Thioclava sp. SK-1]
MTNSRKKIWGWFFFDWASQPYNTLLLTFIFAPFMTDLLGDGSSAQAVWGYGVGIAGIIIALASPFLGAIADRSGRRIPFVALFSVLYIVGAAGLWFANPEGYSLLLIMGSFAVGLIGMEFATTFTNAMLPDLAPRNELGRISGSGWAFGYVGGLILLLIMLTLFQVNPDNGRTLIGLPVQFGLDVATREDTRIVGPLTALWFAVFMIPFFAWVKETRRPDAIPVRAAARLAWPELRATLKTLPAQRSLSAFLLSSMCYRDALNGIYTFGGLYAAGVLGWSITQIGVFGLLTIIAGAVFAWLGGRADDRFGSKSVVTISVVILIAVVLGIITINRTHVLGITVAPGSSLPDIAFFVFGAFIGACGGTLQSASRVMMVSQAEPAKMTEHFGLYALSGKATAFIAPLSIAVVTDITGVQSLGMIPVIVLFMLSLGLLGFVKTAPKGVKDIL